ncbi:ribosomal protein L1p/L10e family-domain-containing protein [Gloeopeniophorella convolvens]|nr:ribosomal protein L1p/L10e family-domain-containing protein [Gloeopeniophorella convolvens]
MAELIDNHVSVKQCKRAVDSLMEYAAVQQQKREETELLPGREENIWLQVAVKQVHSEAKLKPHKIPIKYPLVDPRTSAVCLITKDPQREYKDLLESAGVRFVNRVVGIEKLKGKFKPFEARRGLLRENGLFLADERVVPLLPRLLGKIFFTAKKQPIPVCLTRKDLKGELERAISSTYMHQNRGSCTSVKFGVLSQTPAQVLANLETALPAIVKAIRGGWDNVQSLSIKTTKSASLPIWSCKLGTEEGARWDGLAAESGSESDDEESDEMKVDEPPAKGAKKASEDAPSKSKKRPAEEQGSGTQKKAKGSVPEAPVKPKAGSKGKASPLTSEPPTAPPKKPLEAKPAPESSSSSLAPAASQKKSKAKKQVAPTPDTTALVPVPSGNEADVESAADTALVPPSVSPAASKKSRKERRELVTQLPDAAKTETASAPSPDVVDVPTLKQKKKAKRAPSIVEESSPSAAAAATAALPATEAKTSSKKGKKVTIAEPASPAAAPEGASEPVSAGTASLNKKRKKAKKEATQHDTAEPTAEPSPKATPLSDAELGKKKRKKDSALPSLTAEELKQKRGTGVAGEKKKEKVVKGRTGASAAKEALVGRKAR